MLKPCRYFSPFRDRPNDIPLNEYMHFVYPVTVNFFWQRRPRNFIREVTIFQQMVLQQLNIPNLKKPKTNLNLYLT